MKILAIDSSAVTAGCAVACDGKIRSSAFADTGLTHSQTLMKLASHALDGAGLTVGDVDCVAVACGPGSFTGVRIGVAAAKGLAFANGKKCAAVSTLEAIAYGALGLGGCCCAVMDARRSQVYNALFLTESGVERLTEDRAVSIDDLADELAQRTDTVWLCGDGAALCFERMKDDPRLAGRVKPAPDQLVYQNGRGVALAAEAAAARGELTDCFGLMPVYLRLPQAERELKAKQELSAQSK